MTLMYLACDSHSSAALDKCEMYLDYFLRLFKMMDFNTYGEKSLKFLRRSKNLTLTFKKLKLMSLRVRAYLEISMDYELQKVLYHVKCC